MNPSDWIYHLSLRARLNETCFLDPHLPAPRERAHPARARARRLAIAGAALLAPALVLAAALLGG